MKKIAIVGSGGSGKSTLAKAIGKKLNVPVYHLDALYWNAGWIPTESEAWIKTQREICSRNAWIMDGNYRSTIDLRLAACDTVIFMDTNRYICLYRAFKRLVQYLGRSRPDMSEGCPERVTLQFVRWIWRYPIDVKPQLLSKLQALEHSNTVVILSSNNDVQRFLHQLSEPV